MQEPQNAEERAPGWIARHSLLLMPVWFLLVALTLYGCDSVVAPDTPSLSLENQGTAALKAAALSPAAFDFGTDCEGPTPQAPNTVFILCVPEPWNGDLVVYAHGLVSPSESGPVITPETEEIATMVASLGYAFAATSYSTNGLAAQNGVDDIVDLVVNALPGAGLSAPNHVFLTGPSEGSLITTLAVERHPDLFDGALAVCGPTGNFVKQVNYTGDFRVVFDYFFPGVIPGSPVDIPVGVIADWESGDLQEDVRQALDANPGAARQLLRVLKVPVNLWNIDAVKAAVIDGLENGIVVTNDARLKLGGQPFDNHPRFYFGSNNDFLLNRNVARFDADPVAVQAMQELESTGQLQVFYVSLHTTGDATVPVWQQQLYRWKVLRARANHFHSDLSIPRAGHCTFEESELLVAFALLAFKVTGGLPLLAPEQVLANEDARVNYRRLARKQGLPSSRTVAGFGRVEAGPGQR